MTKKIITIILTLLVIVLVINLATIIILTGIQNEVFKSKELEWNKNTVEVTQASIVYRNDLGWNEFNIQLTIADYNYPETLHGKLPEVKKISYMLSANGIYIEGGSTTKVGTFIYKQEQVDFTHDIYLDEFPSEIQEMINDSSPIEWRITGNIYLQDPDNEDFEIPLNEIYIQTDFD